MQNNIENKIAIASIDRGLSRIEPYLWIINRQKTLRDEASLMRHGIDAAKTSSLLGMVAAGGVGLLLGATGVGIVGGGVGLAGYVASVLFDGLDTGRFAPLPFMRTRIGDRVELMGDATKRQLREEWEDGQRNAGTGALQRAADEELYSYLPKELSNEAMMLATHGPLITSIIGKLPLEQRDRAYLYLNDIYAKFGDAITGVSMQRIQDATSGELSGDYRKMAPAEIQQYDVPQYKFGNEEKKAIAPSPADSQPIASAVSTGGNSVTAEYGDRRETVVNPIAPTVLAAESAIAPISVDQEVNINTVLFAGGRINPHFLSFTLPQRAEIIFKTLKEEGCDIEQFVGDQLMGATGAQRSGKTTLLMMLSILEVALTGKKMFYLTVDDDVYPMAFDGMEFGLDNGKAGYQHFISELPKLKKGSAKDVIWVLDECTKATNRLGEDANEELWNGLLTGFVKTGASVRMVAHGTTSKSMGIPNGFAAQVKDEATFVKALRARDITGKDYAGSGKYPSGVYRDLELSGHSYQEGKETFSVPSWMLFDKTEDGDPCYVRSLLRFFPEMDTRVTGKEPPSILKKDKPKPSVELTPLNYQSSNVHFSEDNSISSEVW